MTEEIPENPVEVYQFPDKYFENLRKWKDTNNKKYSAIQTALYRAISDPDEPYFSESDAVEVSRLLTEGQVDEAENLVYDVLEEEAVE